jgi:plasmid stabilization system protein ParE
MTVRYTRRAQRDLTKILAGIDQENAAGARKVKLALERAIRTIERFPRCGFSTGRAGALGLAVAPYPYVIYWGIEGEDAHILHVRHAARRPWSDKG